MNNRSLSVVIPCRNEEKFIGKCLDSIVVNDFSKDNLEVFVVDGMSDDGTRHIVEKYTSHHPFIKLLNNEKKVTPVAMNIGIKAAKGDYIIILSSHSEISSHFLRTNVESITKNNVDCVGGTLTTLPAKSTTLAESIAFVLAHPFGVGNSHFRIGSSESRYVDTVPFGCYRKDTLERIGLFDEDLVRNQDDELNLRLRKQGGKILLIPSISSSYYGRDSLLKLWKMYYQYGYFKPLVAEKVGGVLTWRQLIPALFVGTLSICAILAFISDIFLLLLLTVTSLYLTGNLFASLSLSLRRGIKYILILPVSFATLHFSYGAGYLKGIWDFILLKKQKHTSISDVPINR